MSLLLVPIMLFALPLFGKCVDRDEPCITPNGENGTCISLPFCNVFLDTVFNSNNSGLEFIRNSECGYENEPLLCCGSVTYYIASTEYPVHSFLPSLAECGTQKTEDRIFGGQITEIGEFPWMVLLGYTTDSNDTVSFKCGGSLINERYILTAAHCVNVAEKTGRLDIIRLGEWRLSTEEDCVMNIALSECADPVVDLKIEKTIPHPKYSRKSGDNDIALVRLERNIKYTDFIQPICLLPFNAEPPKVGTRLVAAGWGSTENGSTSDYKLKLDVPIVSSENCTIKINNRGLISDNQICAGGELGKDSCRGDSGGPLMGEFKTKAKSERQWYQEGIISWGVGCGHKNIPAIYTRVSRYMGWILTNMSEF